MHCIFYKDFDMTMLEPRKWVKGMDKASPLNMLWVLHYIRTPLTMVVIKQLLCYDGSLWLEEMITIIDMLIHRITQLAHLGENPAMAFGGKIGEHDLIEAMKKKFKVTNKPNSYAITDIIDPTIKVAMQILVGNIMRKCHANKVSAPVVALAAQCAEGVQFN